MSLIIFENVSKTYNTGEIVVAALRKVSFEIEEGEICLLVGESGAGKTTLLNLLGGLDSITKGRILWSHLDMTSFSKKDLTGYRRNGIGFIFKSHNLIPNLTVIENVEAASQLAKKPLEPVKLLEELGLKDKIKHFPAQLSYGEQQKVAIARAVVKNPRLILCDEPTGALDYKTGKEILKIIQDTCQRLGIGAIIATHNTRLSPMADRTIKIKSGRVKDVLVNENVTSVENIEW
jgi:putative ABC transport system ATP-binding protein